MKNYTLQIIGIMALLMLGCSLVCAADVPLTPEMASKAEMVRNQQKQRVTPAQRKAAADALKLQREKIDQAQKASAPASAETLPAK